MLQSHTILYTSNTRDDFFKTVLTINPDLKGGLKMVSNRDMRDDPAGLFEASIPEHLFDSVMMKTGEADFANSPGQGTLIPDY